MVAARRWAVAVLPTPWDPQANRGQPSEKLVEFGVDDPPSVAVHSHTLPLAAIISYCLQGRNATGRSGCAAGSDRLRRSAPVLVLDATDRPAFLVELLAGPHHEHRDRLRDDRYVEITRAEPGQRLRLVEPFGVSVDLADLASRTRPAG